MGENQVTTEQQITLTLPDGSQKTFHKGVTGREVARSISPKLERDALSITVNEEIRDLDRPIHEDSQVRINTWDSDDGKFTFWHSSAHLMAEAVQELFPEARFAIGPPVDKGFYYDVDLGERRLSAEDVEAIEQKMIELARRKNTFHRREVPKEEALDYYRNKDNPYKQEMIQELEEGTITFYEQGSFTDLCRGPHIPTTDRIKAAKITNVAGAYWRGDENNKQLTRLYGITFPKKSMLDDYLEKLEEARRRDHKKLGRELELFMLDGMVGSGLPMWLPNGAVLRRTLETFLRQEQLRRGYQEVITPHIGNLKLYETSGHYPYYQDSQFAPMYIDEEGFLLKPMNCPHHHRIYAHRLRSYRELPVRYAEFGTVYRYEQHGELTGLTRVRGFTQDDAHIYCTPDQLKGEIAGCIELTRHVFSTFDMPVDIRLSFRDENDDKYGGASESWERAQREIREVADEMQLDYTVAEGEASFYGPKVDFIIRDALDRQWQLGTVQVDYVMPERFDLTYTGADNQKHRPVIIHRAPFGSMERFCSILIEHFAGYFPVWLAPVQCVVIPVSDAFSDYARQCAETLSQDEVRVETDLRSEQIGAKIRDAETRKIPYMLIVGEREAANGRVAPRRHREGDLGSMDFQEFRQTLHREITEKRVNKPE